MKRVKFIILIAINMIFLSIQLKIKSFDKVIIQYCNKYNSREIKNYSNEEKLRLMSELNLIIESIEDASRMLPTNVKCLHRTLIGFKYLRGKRGIPIKFVIGVRKFPFESHAWLKWSDSNFGDNLIDPNEHTREYEVIIDSSNYIESR